jgi:uncharacterized membrane protein YgdD (TMEM256/DUF423 family)
MTSRYVGPMMNRSLAAVAALSGALAVAIGAFAAHGAGPAIKSLLTTGGHYLLVHALLALVCARWGGRLPEVAGWLAVAGGLVFCLSLALIGWLSAPAFGAVAPIGGVLMILAWLLAAYAAFRRDGSSASPT